MIKYFNFIPYVFLFYVVKEKNLFRLFRNDPTEDERYALYIKIALLLVLSLDSMFDNFIFDMFIVIFNLSLFGYLYYL